LAKGQIDLPKPVYRMTNIPALSMLMAIVVLMVFLPATLVGVWHIVIWLLSAGLIAIVIDEHGDLDSGFVAFAILILMVSGIVLCAIAGLSWAVTLLLAFPLLSTIGLLMARSHQH
jgi:hypothetical protein